MARRPLKLDADKLPLFEVEVSLAEGHSGLVLTPQHGAFTEASAALLSGLVDMCCSVERILENADLVEGVVGESDVEVATPMRDLILDDDFDEHKATCLQLVDTSYDQVNEFVARYEPYRCAPHMRACTPSLQASCVDRVPGCARCAYQCLARVVAWHRACSWHLLRICVRS